MLKQPNFFFTNFAKQYDECHYIKKKNTNKKKQKKVHIFTGVKAGTQQ